MSPWMSVLLVATWIAVPGLAWAQVEELTPEKIAAIRRDEQAAQARVDAAYGNRKPSEMSTEERQQAIRAQQAAGIAVMEKHGVSDKDYARRVARLSLVEREAVAREEKRLEDEEKKAQAAREAEEKKKQEEEERALAPEDIPIQTGFGDNNPVELESTEEAASMVEQGLPPGAEEADGASGAAMEAGSKTAPAAPAARPAKKKRRK